MTPVIDSSTLCVDPAIWCCVPVYNNSATIADVARRCRLQMANVVVVDDGSTDADLRELLATIDVQVVRHETNRGKGAALQSGFRFAAGRGAQYLITLDGDGQHFPEDIPRFLPKLAPDTILVGYRHEVSGEMPRSSRFGREFSDFWIEVETGREIRDTQSGFRAYPLPAVLALDIDSRHYNFEVEVLTKAIWAGLRAGTVLIRVWYPSKEERVSSFRAFRDNLRIARVHTRLVARQLLPLPHRQLPAAQSLAGSLATRGCLPSRELGSQAAPLDGVLHQNASPIGLAAAVGLSVFLGILLWPWGLLVIAYLAIRLHLNKIAVIVGTLLSIPPAVTGFSRLVGHWVVRNSARPRLENFVGTHLVAFAIAAISMGLVVKFSTLLRRHSAGIEA